MNNRGSVSVFLLLVLSTIIISVGFFIKISNGILEKSMAIKTTKACEEYALNSYNLYTADNYGLMGYFDDNVELESTTSVYLNRNINEDLSKLIKVEVDPVEKLSDIDVFASQINEIALLYVTAEMIESSEVIIEGINSKEEIEDIDEKAVSGFEVRSKEELEEDIKNEREREKKKAEKREAEGLAPKSRKTDVKDEIQEQKEKETGILSKFEKLQEELDRLKNSQDNRSSNEYIHDLEKISELRESKINLSYDEKIKFALYIQGTFKDGVLQEGKEFSFFNREDQIDGLEYEVEYILNGKDKDNENWKDINLKIFGLREISNGISFFMDKKKTTALKAVVGSDPTFIATAVVIVGTVVWISAESYMDVRALKRGESVAILKKSDQWFISLENLMAGKIIASKVDSTSSSKLNSEAYYSDYTFLFLLGLKDDLLVSRTMDLVNLNIYTASDKKYKLEDLISKHKISVEIKDIYRGDKIEFEITNGY